MCVSLVTVNIISPSLYQVPTISLRDQTLSIHSLKVILYGLQSERDMSPLRNVKHGDFSLKLNNT